jgi:hypothetical protein
MNAIVYTKFGLPDVFQLKEVEKTSRSEKNGWIVVHLEGVPEVIG